MSYDPHQHQRRSIRLRGYDYAQPGEYFVTICVQQHECLLGKVVADEMAPNDAGEMVASWWTELPRKFPSCGVDGFVVMPNHVHGIVVIREAAVGADASEGGDDRGAHPSLRSRAGSGAPLQVSGIEGPPDRVTLGSIVQWFKTMTTNAYVRGVTERGWTPFIERLWQRNYYEHIVRDEDDLGRVRDYITNNPRSWKDDPDNPSVATSTTS